MASFKDLTSAWEVEIVTIDGGEAAAAEVIVEARKSDSFSDEPAKAAAVADVHVEGSAADMGPS